METETNNHAVPFYEKRESLILILAGILLVGLLWVSWSSGWYPFAGLPIAGSPTTTSVATIPEQTQEDILHSLSATESSTSSPTAILKTLTPSSSGNIVTNTAEILDSLTPKK